MADLKSFLSGLFAATAEGRSRRSFVLWVHALAASFLAFMVAALAFPVDEGAPYAVCALLLHLVLGACGRTSLRLRRLEEKAGL